LCLSLITDTVVPMTNQTPNPEQAIVDAYASAYEARKRAEAVEAQAKAMLTDYYAQQGITRATTSNGSTVVCVEQVSKREFDTEALRGKVSDKVFTAVTKTAVDTKSFDKAVGNGDISNDTVTAVVSIKPYTRVTVGEAVAVASVAV
jgi:hypothetical protein